MKGKAIARDTGVEIDKKSMTFLDGYCPKCQKYIKTFVVDNLSFHPKCDCGLYWVVDMRLVGRRR